MEEFTKELLMFQKNGESLDDFVIRVENAMNALYGIQTERDALSQY